MIFRRFDEMKNNFTKSEEKLKEYIVSNLDLVQKYNASELADKTGVSQATIVRFSKKLGYKGFPEMRIALNKEEDTDGAIVHHKVSVEDDLYTTNKKIVGLNTQAIMSTFELIEESVLHEALDLIEGARKIMVVGVAASGLVAKDFAYKLIKLGKNVYSESDTQIQLGSLNSFGEEDLVIAISHSGTSSDVIKVVEAGRRNGAKVLSITKFTNNPLSKRSDLRLRTSANEETFRVSSITSRIAQLTIVDILFVNLIKRNYDEYSKLINASADIVKTYRNR